MPQNYRYYTNLYYPYMRFYHLFFFNFFSKYTVMPTTIGFNYRRYIYKQSSSDFFLGQISDVLDSSLAWNFYKSNFLDRDRTNLISSVFNRLYGLTDDPFFNSKLNFLINPKIETFNFLSSYTFLESLRNFSFDQLISVYLDIIRFIFWSYEHCPDEVFYTGLSRELFVLLRLLDIQLSRILKIYSISPLEGLYVYRSLKEKKGLRNPWFFNWISYSDSFIKSICRSILGEVRSCRLSGIALVKKFSFRSSGLALELLFTLGLVSSNRLSSKKKHPVLFFRTSSNLSFKLINSSSLG